MGTGRARGKHIPRGLGEPGTPEGDGIGASDRMASDPSPIPGGAVHLVNPPTIRQRTPVPDSPAEIKDLNAHGVPPDEATARERAEFMRGPNGVKPIRPAYSAPAVEPVPVPVRIVEARRPRVLRTSSHRSLTVPANATEAVRLTGQDGDRVEVQLLNESATNHIRIAQSPRDLSVGGGTLLPAGATGYLTIKSQDELYALSANGSASTISVIQLFEQPW